MSSSGLVHNSSFILDGTNYEVWKIRMLDSLRVMDPYIERILYRGYSPPKNPKRLSLMDENNSYLDAQASNMIFNALSNVVIMSVTPFRNAHELWTKLQDKYDVSNICGDDSPSTSGHDEFSTSSTSPTCGKPQNNAMVSGDEYCNDDSEFIIDDPSALSYCNDLSLDLNTSSTKNDLHACVDSPCISCKNCLINSRDDMLSMSCFLDKNASISSSICLTNNVEETEHSMEQDMDLNGALSNSSSSSSITHFCLMAKASEVFPTLDPNISHDDCDDDFDDSVSSLKEKGQIVFNALRKNKSVCSNFIEILTIAIESKKLIDEHEVSLKNYEDTIDKMQSREYKYADEIADLKEALEEEETTKESLEETFSLELSRVKGSHDRALEVANDLKIKNGKLIDAHAKLLEDFEHLKNGSRVIKDELIKLTESHAQLKASYSKELVKLPSPIAIKDGYCATNYVSCESSILTENVELRAQLELLSNNYGKLEERHNNSQALMRIF